MAARNLRHYAAGMTRYAITRFNSWCERNPGTSASGHAPNQPKYDELGGWRL